MRNSAAVLLFALAAPLAAQTPSIPGLDTAGMDRSVRPGDDFYPLRQRHLVHARRRSRPTGARFGAFNIAAEPPTGKRRGGDRRHRAAAATRPRAATSARWATSTRAYLDTAAIEPRGLAPIRPLLD